MEEKNNGILNNSNDMEKENISIEKKQEIKKSIKETIKETELDNKKKKRQKKQSIRTKISAYFKDIKDTPTKKTTVYMIFLAPLLVNFVVESLNKKSVLKCLGLLAGDFQIFFINYLIILFTISFALLTKKRIATIITISSVWMGMGITNFVIKIFRETPFSFTDIRLIGSVKDIIGNYLTPFNIILIIAMVCLVVLIIIGLYIKLPKYDNKISYPRSLLYIAILFLLMIAGINVGVANDWVSEKFPNMTIAYQNYGFAYCFANSIINVGVKKPDTYSEASLEEIVEKIKNEKTVDSNKVSTPNIIFLQLESFFDVNKVKDLELSKEATPIFNGLKEEFPSGYLSVNNVGYGTANTEFEIMTGMNLEDFGPGEFPYKTVLMKQTCESMSFILREYGYVTHAMHNNTATFYARNDVFKNLGFDTFTSIEYMHPTEFTPLNWVKDSILTDEIIKVLNSTDETDYLYCISVQGHGSYPTERIIEEPVITVSGIENEERRCQFEYYVNQIKEMDDFIGELIDKLSQYNEDVILVMYGDHLPSLAITEEEITNGNLYQTEYVIWSNFNFKLDDKDIETFELGSRIMKALNIDGGVINKFHQIYDDSENYLHALKSLEYDILYGDMYVYGGQSQYMATDMKMGTNEIIITDVIKDEGQFDIKDDNNQEDGIGNKDIDDDNNKNPAINLPFNNTSGENDNTISDNVTDDEDNKDDNTYTEEFYADSYIVCGKNFTNYSVVYINGEFYNTEYIDDTKLRVHIPELNSLDTFSVKQSYLGKILSKTSDYIYIRADILQEEENQNTKAYN